MLSALLQDILKLFSSLHVRSQVSHPYKTAGKILVLYILISRFLDSRQRPKILNLVVSFQGRAYPECNMLLLSLRIIYIISVDQTFMCLI
jgi:hypothetical protein